MVLWKKESRKDDAMYVQLFPFEGAHRSIEDVLNSHNIHNDEKSDKSATEFRSSGNEKFQDKCWLEAIELYNKSLRFSIDGSENIALAYANRSACFLHMKKYDECLVDIELARKANYPQRLMPKLSQREAECLKMMKESNQVETKVKPSLSFDPDEKFPCVANVLEIRSNEQFGKHIVSKSDIEVGQIVLVEKALVADASDCDRSSCETCLKFVTNFIPCPNCSDVMFCDVNCMESNKVHKLGCGAGASYNAVKGFKRLVGTILIAVSAFSNNIDELMKFVEKHLDTRDFDSLEGISGEQLRYGRFLKLATVRMEMTATGVAGLYQLLSQIPKIEQLFDSKQKQRFLMHLLWQHILITKMNGILLRADEDTSIGVVGNYMSLFNHACYDNVGLELCGNQIIGYAIRPIERGEQLFIRYTTIENRFSTEVRRTFLWNGFQFECKCSMCMLRFEPIDCIRMRSDPIYQFSGQTLTEDILLDYEQRSFFKEKFRQFLSKYGRLPWTIEIDLAMIGFMKCMQEDLKLV